MIARVFGVGVLWLAVVASAMGVVYVTHQSRQQTHLLEQLRDEAQLLQVRWGQYLIEQSTWAAFGRVEKLAEQRLQMRVPEPQAVIKVEP